MNTLDTPRLHLRHYRDSDLDAVTAMCVDPVVNEFMGPAMDDAAIDAMIGRYRLHHQTHGYGILMVTEQTNKDLVIGFTGVWWTRFEAHFTPSLEVGWRFAASTWGKGYATEAAGACVDWAFANLDVPGIVSFTVPQNIRSRRVMEKLGFVHDPGGDFDHPQLAVDDPLRRHVLYRKQRPQSGH